MDGLTYPAEIIRMYENVDSSRELEVVETAMTFCSENFAPPFLVIDLRRYQWPKTAGSTWGPESYASKAIKHRNSTLLTIDVFPAKTELSRMQIEFGLEAGASGSTTTARGEDAALDDPADDRSDDDAIDGAGEFSFFCSDF